MVLAPALSLSQADKGKRREAPVELADAKRSREDRTEGEGRAGSPVMSPIATRRKKQKVVHSPLITEDSGVLVEVTLSPDMEEDFVDIDTEDVDGVPLSPSQVPSSTMEPTQITGLGLSLPPNWRSSTRTKPTAKFFVELPQLNPSFRTGYTVIPYDGQAGISEGDDERMLAV